MTIKKDRVVLELRDICKHYGKGHSLVKALDKISFMVYEGEYIVIIGPSGSGKSTLLNIMGLLDEPTSGEIYVGGVNTVAMSDDKKAEIRNKKIGFVFQMYNLIPSLTALENAELPQTIMGIEKKEREEKSVAILKKLGVEERSTHLPNELSGGEKQRVAIARALINNPDIILADEPTGNLDTQRGKDLVKLLKELNKEGKTIIIVTHDLDIAKGEKKVIKLRDGEIVNS